MWWRWVLWSTGLALSLVCFAAGIILWLGMNEDICFDRHPWWGPPESGDPNAYCSGGLYEKHKAGYGWFGPGLK